MFSLTRRASCREQAVEMVTYYQSLRTGAPGVCLPYLEKAQVFHELGAPGVRGRGIAFVFRAVKEYREQPLIWE